MTSTTGDPYRQLREDEIELLQGQRCTAQDWRTVQVADPFHVARVVEVRFEGEVRIGRLEGELEGSDGRLKPAGVYRATLTDCTVGHGVRIANIGSHVTAYQIEDGALVENVGVLESHRGARFGNGIEMDVLNEAGGREVVLFNDLSSQFAYFLCVHRYVPQVIKRLTDMARREADRAVSDRGTVGAGARIVGVSRIVDVNIGPAAQITGAQALVNGTVLSELEAPTIVGDGVIAEDFILAEGAMVTGGAMVTRSYIGQACQVGRQFSAENCVFAANGEAFHGEGCSVLAGPYTVTHHKSSLLIGGMFSFFNAGSGTNQSNHRYKLGPTHEGKLERGCKTGSFSYVMWPCRVGPFSVILGKHTRSFDTRDLPFSHLEADEHGRCSLIPGQYIATVGTLRDGGKWPNRDRRKTSHKRDLVSFAVFNPLTVGRMQRGAEMLARLQQEVPRSAKDVNVNGVDIKRVLLRTGHKRYASQVKQFLREQIVLRLEQGFAGAGASIRRTLGATGDGQYSGEWVDVGGQLMGMSRLEQLRAEIVSDQIESVDQLHEALRHIDSHYHDDQWEWVRETAKSELEIDLDRASLSEISQLISEFSDQQQKFLRLIILDAEREYDEASRVGFGIDGGPAEKEIDFAAVRGTCEQHAFVRQLTADIEAVDSRCSQLQSQLADVTSKETT